jgi:hypothetical protein
MGERRRSILLPKRHLEPHQREAQISFLLPDRDRSAVIGKIEVILAPLAIAPAERQSERPCKADDLARLIDREVAVPEIPQRNLSLYRR